MVYTMATSDDSFDSVHLPESTGNDDRKQSAVDDNIRILLITAAVLLLNLGLFFILTYFASLVTGILAGYLIRERKKALISSFIGTFGGYMILFYMQSDSLLAYLLESEILQDIPADMIAPLFWTSVILAAIILSILGIIGVYIAHRMFVKSEEPKYQQSGVLE